MGSIDQMLCYVVSNFIFVDVDECYKNLDNCASNTARCINTEGSFLCRCNDGYSGNGTVCEGKFLSGCKKFKFLKEACFPLACTAEPMGDEVTSKSHMCEAFSSALPAG